MIRIFVLTFLLVASSGEFVHDCKVFNKVGCEIENATVRNHDQILLPENKTESEIKVIKFKSSKFESVVLSEFLEKFTKLDELVIESCSGVNGLTDLSLRNLLKTVKVENSDLSEITEKTFHTGYRLKTISLNNNGIKKIPKNTFTHLKKLEKILLTSNEISWLDDDTFGSCKELQVIDLSKNSLKSISSNVFSKIPKLFKLLLGDNQINSIEHGFLTDLQYSKLNTIELTQNSCINENFVVLHSSDQAIIENDLKSCQKNFVVLENANETVKNFLVESSDEINHFYSEIIARKEKEIENLTEQIKSLNETLENLVQSALSYQKTWFEENNQEYLKFTLQIQNELNQIKNTSEMQKSRIVQSSTSGNSWIPLVSIIIIVICFKPRKFITDFVKCSKQNSEAKS